MIVEDEALIALDLERRLLSLGYDVVGTADHFEEALEVIESGRPDLVLMDVQMPIMDGYEATEELRRIGFDSPILAVTAYALARDLKRALSVGCNDFVTKPFDQVCSLVLTL